MNPPKLLIAAGIAGALSMAVCHAYAAESAAGFVRKASVANEFEIESSKLALEKSQDKDIKSFAQRMIDDHKKAGDDMKEALSASKLDLKPETQLDDKHQQIIKKLESLSTDDFNNAYVAAQVDAHDEAVSLFSDYAKNGGDEALKHFASETLPTLKSHQTHVKDLKAKR